jgi:single-strand DNA-binding protein
MYRLEGVSKLGGEVGQVGHAVDVGVLFRRWRLDHGLASEKETQVMTHLHVELHAKVGAEPVERQTRAGKRYFTLALTVKPDRVGDTEWVNVTVFEPLANEIPTDLEPGEMVFVSGELRLNRWKDREGNARTNLQVTADELTRMGRREGTRSGREPSASRRHWQRPLGEAQR